MSAPQNIDEALLAFQADPPVLTKDKKAHNSSYADLVQVNEVVLPRLTALGLVWKAKATMSANGDFGLQYELKHVASGTSEEGVWPLKRVDNPQQMGSLVTYARRYALCAVLNIVAEEDDDGGAAASGQRYAQRANQQRAAGRRAPAEGGQQVQRAQRASRPPLPGEDPDGPVGQDQHRHMHALWRELGKGGDEHRDFRLQRIAGWLELTDLESSANLTRAQASVVIGKLREIKDAMGGGQ